MDGFRVVKLNEVIRQVDVVITCTGKYQCFGVHGGLVTLRPNLESGLSDKVGETCAWCKSLRTRISYRNLNMFSRTKSLFS